MVVEKLRAMKLAEGAEIFEHGTGETLSYPGCRREHWRYLHTNNPQERLMREMRRLTRVVGAFPDGNSVLMLGRCKAPPCRIDQMGSKRYLHMNRMAGIVIIA